MKTTQDWDIEWEGSGNARWHCILIPPHGPHPAPSRLSSSHFNPATPSTNHCQDAAALSSSRR